jgi:hypothetical protein
MLVFIQTESRWPKQLLPGAQGRVPGDAARADERVGFAKNVLMDQRKLDVARRALGVDTETEAIDQALDFIAFRKELADGFAAVREGGGVDDVLERRRKA